MDTRERIIQIARRRGAGLPDIPLVLDVARTTDDRYLLGICLDCFRSVLQDSSAEVAFEVVRFLGQLLRDPAYRRIRKRVLMTAIWIGRASYLILPELVAAFQRPTTLCVLRPARWAVIIVGWEALAHGGPAERAVAVWAFEQIRSLGLLNLRSFLESEACRADVREEVQVAIARLAVRYRD